MPGSVFGKRGNWMKAQVSSQDDIANHLTKAVDNNNLERLKDYLKFYKNPGFIIKAKNMSLLDYVVAKSRLDIFNYLYGEIGGYDITENTIVVALSMSDDIMFEQVFRRRNIPDNLPGGETTARLIIGNQEQSEDIIIEKLKQARLDNLIFSKENTQGKDSYNLALDKKKFKVFKYLISQSSRERLNYSFHDMLNEPKVDIDTIKFLISEGADVNSVLPDKNHTLMVPLAYAAKHNNIEIIKLLLNSGANVDGGNRGLPPLFYSIEQGNKDIVKLLRDAGASAKRELMVDGKFIKVLDYALTKKNKDIIKLLSEMHIHDIMEMLRNGKDIKVDVLLLVFKDNIDVKDQEGKTALMYSVLHRNMNLIKVILDNGANIDLQDKEGKTALMYAAMKDGKLEILKYLIKKGANLNLQDKEGSTALFIATKTSNFSIIKFLIKNNADLNIKNNDGNTAEFYAISSEIKALFNGLGVVKIWKGYTRSDIDSFNIIFGADDPYNHSHCPVCLKYIMRQDGCLYLMDHDCSSLPGYYHEDLYEKYKSEKGTIVWCTACGRICQSHQHYALSRAEEDVPGLETKSQSSPFGNDCRPYGGGPPEKAMRYKALREKAFEIKDQAGKISEDDAMDQLVIAAWNGPLDARFNASENLKAKKWLEHPIENYPVTGAIVANVIYPDVPVPPERQMPKLVQGTNAATLDDGDVLVFIHPDPKTGESFHESVHPDSLCNKGSFLNAINMTMTTATADMQGRFGRCWDGECKAILYPIEVKTALELYGELTPEETELYNNYKKKFNEKFSKRSGGGNSSEEEAGMFRPLTDGVCLLPPKQTVKSSKGGRIRTRKNKHRVTRRKRNRKQYKPTRTKRY